MYATSSDIELIPCVCVCVVYKLVNKGNLYMGDSDAHFNSFHRIRYTTSRKTNKYTFTYSDWHSFKINVRFFVGTCVCVCGLAGHNTLCVRFARKNFQFRQSFFSAAHTKSIVVAQTLKICSNLFSYLHQENVIRGIWLLIQCSHLASNSSDINVMAHSMLIINARSFCSYSSLVFSLSTIECYIKWA